MLSIVKVGRLAIMLSLLAGCAGKDFVRPNAEAFRLGETTYGQVTQLMGEPRKTGDVLKNEKSVKAITYVYAAAGGEPLEEGVTPARALSYYFHNDVLVGQEFLSSFKSDASNFDDSKVSAIARGKTTRAEVIQTFGKPTASFVFPMMKTSREALGYTYNTTRGGVFSGFKFFTKTLRIAFDDKDIVSDIDFTTTGTR